MGVWISWNLKSGTCTTRIVSDDSYVTTTKKYHCGELTTTAKLVVALPGWAHK